MKVYLILVIEVAILVNELKSEGKDKIELNEGVINLKDMVILLYITSRKIFWNKEDDIT